MGEIRCSASMTNGVGQISARACAMRGDVTRESRCSASMTKGVIQISARACAMRRERVDALRA